MSLPVHKLPQIERELQPLLAHHCTPSLNRQCTFVPERVQRSYISNSSSTQCLMTVNPSLSLSRLYRTTMAA